MAEGVTTIPICVRKIDHDKYLHQLPGRMPSDEPIGELVTSPREDLATGKWTALAHIYGIGLCLVEVSIKERT